MLCSLFAGRAFAVPDQSWRFSIAFGSCADNPESPIWEAIKEAGPDALVLLGDTIYMVPDEWRHPEAIRARYLRLANNDGFLALKKTVPIFSVWDDHDFGPNNADSRFAFRKNSLRAFKEMFPDHPKAPEGLGDGIAFEKDFGSVLLLVTDNRSYRVNSGGMSEAVMFGEVQLKWLENRLRDSTAKAVIIAAGNQFLPQSGSSQSFFPYAKEKKRLLVAIEQAKMPVVLLSGDRHYGQLIVGKVGKKTVLEAASSPFTAAPRDNVPKIQLRDGVEKFTTVAGVHNFGMLQLSGLENGTVTARAEIRIPSGFVAGATEVSWGQQPLIR